MHCRHVAVLTALVSAAPVVALAAQGLPAAQPQLLVVYREDVKPGHIAAHGKLEAGWPAAFRRAGSKGFYLALVSMTGPSEAWFIEPSTSHADLEAKTAAQESNTALTAELDRLAAADAEHISNARALHLVARGDLSHGAYPDMARQRYWQITWYRVRPGHEGEFEAAAKAYAAAAGRGVPGVSFRTYQVVAGVPGPTFLVFSSVTRLGEFDQSDKDGDAVMAAATPDEQAAIGKFLREGVINYETQRFRLDPRMSYVPPETIATDPAFWSPPKPAPKR